MYDAILQQLVPNSIPCLRNLFYLFQGTLQWVCMHAWAAADWTKSGLPQSFFSDTSQSVARQIVAYKTKRPKEISPTFIMEKNLAAATRRIVYCSWFPLYKWTLYSIASDYITTALNWDKKLLLSSLPMRIGNKFLSLLITKSRAKLSLIFISYLLSGGVAILANKVCTFLCGSTTDKGRRYKPKTLFFFA